MISLIKFIVYLSFNFKLMFTKRTPLAASLGCVYVLPLFYVYVYMRRFWGGTLVELYVFHHNTTR